MEEEIWKLENTSEWFSVITTLFAVATLLNGILSLLLLRNKKPLSPVLLLLLNNLGTNTVDATLLYIAQILEKSLDLDHIYLRSSQMLVNKSCDYKKRWTITLHLGLPFKLAAHCAMNNLGNVICLYVNGLFADSRGTCRYMSRHRALDFVVLSWLLSLFLMWHPMLISCSDVFSFHFVLYSWTGYASLVVLLSISLSMATCGRTVCVSDDMWIQRTETKAQVRLQAFLMLFLIVLLIVTLLLAPFLELLEIKGYEHLISRLYSGSAGDEWVIYILKPILRNLPYLFYLIQPIFFIIGFKEMRERLKISGRNVAFDLRPHFKRPFSCRITAV